MNDPGHGIVLPRAGGLVERAADRLAGGPLPTVEVARQVLGLRGEASACARAVWTLLGDDPRFVVDAGGTWSVREARPAPLPTALRATEWVVVDVETTGTSARTGHRVTEIAAVRVRGGLVEEEFSTLVNPGRPIPSAITSLTGITNEMVAGAPPFEQVAAELCDFLADGVFVAHNASFDWGFVAAEVERCEGRLLTGRRLCTVQLARRLLPQLPSRALGALVHYFGIHVNARHRAGDDARATADILLRFLEMLEEREISDWAGLQALLARRNGPRARRRSALPRSMDEA
jgi:DNA polymerase III subunit epsilon